MRFAGEFMFQGLSDRLNGIFKRLRGKVDLEIDLEALRKKDLR